MREVKLDPSCGCQGEFLEGAIALYGVRAIYHMNRNGHHTFDLVPTFAHLVARDSETEEQFREDLQDPETGLIKMARLLFRDHPEFYMAEEDFENYHKAPTKIFDLGHHSFHAWRRGSYVYVTWAMFDKPYDWEELTKWARIKCISEWMEDIKRDRFKYFSRREKDEIYRYDV